MGLTLLGHASIPLKFWDEAFLIAVFFINRLSSRVINDQSPFERMFGHPPDYSFLCTFGYAIWPNLRPYNSRKLQFRSKSCVFLGYSNMHKGFKCLDPSVGRVYISRDVVFYEHIFPFASLRPNAGARLRAEILLLPDSLRPSNTFGDAISHDQHQSSPLPNVVPSTRYDDTGTGENCGANSEEIGVETNLHGPYHVCPRDDNGGARS
jgi:hypothetical protein